MVDLGVTPATNVAIMLYSWLQLATSTFVLSTLDVYLHSHIPQALCFYYILQWKTRGLKKKEVRIQRMAGRVQLRSCTRGIKLRH